MNAIAIWQQENAITVKLKNDPKTNGVAAVTPFSFLSCVILNCGVEQSVQILFRI
jgi:hypothetical protein